MADLMADLEADREGCSRMYGEGTKPKQRKDGAWIATVEAGFTERGTRRRRSVVAKTEAECKRRIRDLRRDMLKGEATTLDPRTTVKRWADAYLADYETRARPRTVATTRGMISKWVVPTIGTRPLRELTPGDLRKVDQAVTAAGRSATTVRNVRTALVTMLKAAIAEGHHIPASVMGTKKPPPAVNPREPIPTRRAAVLLFAAAHKDDWPALDGDAPKQAREDHRIALEVDKSRWAAALLLGVRSGEARGLTWDCVDWERGLLDISWQLQSIPTDSTPPANYEMRHVVDRYFLVRPKSDAGTRWIPMVPWFAAALREWSLESPRSTHGLVWPRASGRPVRPADDRAAWRGLQRAAGLADGERLYVVHEARHTAATILAELGVDPAVRRAITGHAGEASARPYEHFGADPLAAALEASARMLELVPAPPK